MSDQHTAVILLGASRFPDLESVRPSVALRKSSTGFKEYILENFEEFQCSQDLILDLFDSDESGSKQLEEIHRFLNFFTKKTASANGYAIRNLVIHYAGHGLILGESGEFGLAVNYTKSEMLIPTCITMGQFAETIKAPARFMRKFMIIDCCFAAKIINDWLPGDSAGSLTQLVQRETANEFQSEGRPGCNGVPKRGTAVLCAADKDSVAIGSHPTGTTLFTGALLDALARQDAKDRYSLQELNELTWQCILESNHSVRPVIFSPDQRDGDIASLQIFPRWKKKQTVKEFEKIKAKKYIVQLDMNIPDNMSNEFSESTVGLPKIVPDFMEKTTQKKYKTSIQRWWVRIIVVLILLGSIWVIISHGDTPLKEVIMRCTYTSGHCYFF